MFPLRGLCSAPGAVWGGVGLGFLGGFALSALWFCPQGSGSVSFKPSPAEGQGKARQEGTREEI